MANVEKIREKVCKYPARTFQPYADMVVPKLQLTLLFLPYFMFYLPLGSEMKPSPAAMIACKDTYLSLLSMFDRAGVPPESHWRSLLLFFREIKDYSHLSDMQKISVQTLLADVLEQREYSPERLDSVLKEYHAIIVNPYKNQIDMLVKEAGGMLSEFQKVLARRHGDIEHLEEESISIVLENEDEDASIARLRQAFSQVKIQLEADLRHLENVATLDGVTRLTNRRGFDNFMKEAIGRWLSEARPLALAMFDIDHFKKFNDEYGHRIGDQVLAVVGTHLKKSLRAFDERNIVLAARFGGEEFTLAVSGPDAADLPKVAHQCCSLIKTFNFLLRDPEGNVLENGLNITVSAGVALADMRWRGAYLENLIDNADRALYFAKRSGRNAVYEFKAELENPFVKVDAS